MQLFLSQCWVTGFSHDDGWTGCLSSAGYWKWGKQILFCHGRPLMTWAASCTVSQAGWGPFLHLSPQSEGNDTGEPRGGSWRARHLHLPSQESRWPTHTHTNTHLQSPDTWMTLCKSTLFITLSPLPAVLEYIYIFQFSLRFYNYFLLPEMEKIDCCSYFGLALCWYVKMSPAVTVYSFTDFSMLVGCCSGVLDFVPGEKSLKV